MLDDLTHDVNNLKRNNSQYLCVRKRTLDFYRRDSLGVKTRRKRQRIQVAKELVHGWDAVADVELYLSLLNKVATRRLRREPISADISNAFGELVELINGIPSQPALSQAPCFQLSVKRSKMLLLLLRSHDGM